MTLAMQNRFHMHDLRPEEILAGSKLSELQKQCVQNLIAGYAHDALNVPYDDTRPHQSEYLRNYYRGAMEALEHLLHTDEELRDAESSASPEE